MILVRPSLGCLPRRKRAAFQRLAREERFLHRRGWLLGAAATGARTPCARRYPEPREVFYRLRQLYRQPIDDSTGG